MYFVRIPNIVKKLYTSIIWHLPNEENKIYLTFDDGPHPEVTPKILSLLKEYNAKATFFCLGKNVEKYPEIIEQILNNGHAIGNHGYAHLNGWKTNDKIYFENFLNGNEILKQIHQANYIFRPAYGKIKLSQIKIVHRSSFIVNWSLMPGDFDAAISSEKCYQNLINNVKSGDIIVLHDNEKSWKHLEYCLPKWLEFIHNKGLKPDSITLQQDGFS